MDGDRAPVEEIVAIKNRYGAMLLLDEAHAIGVIGDCGRGLADKRGVASMVDLQMGTLGKALGSAGGYICARRPVIDLLINRARSFIYSTRPLPAGRRRGQRGPRVSSNLRPAASARSCSGSASAISCARPRSVCSRPGRSKARSSL